MYDSISKLHSTVLEYIHSSISILIEMDLVELSSANNRTNFEHSYKSFEDDYNIAKTELSFSYAIEIITGEEFEDLTITFENIYVIANNIKSMKEKLF